MEDAISHLKGTLVDHWVGDLEEKGLKKLEYRWTVNMRTLFTGSNTRNEVLNSNRKGEKEKTYGNS
jgi:hypothetical protein